MKWGKYVILLIILSWGCTARREKSNNVKLKTLKLQRDLAVSTDSMGTVVGGLLSNLTVDDRGNIYFYDGRKGKIDVLNARGHYLRSYGARGKGPGEFLNLFNIKVYRDTLYVIEFYPNRLTRFQLNNHKLIDVQKYPDIRVGQLPMGIPYSIYPLNENRYALIFRNNLRHAHPKVTYSIYNRKLQPVDIVLHQFPQSQRLQYQNPENKGMYGFRVDLLPKTIIRFGPDGYLYEASSDSLHIRVYNHSGRKIRDISSPYLPPALTRHDLDSLANAMDPTYQNMFHKALKQYDLPDRWLALHDFLVDEQGRCWAALKNPGKEFLKWRVFDAGGNARWKFNLSRSIDIYAIRKMELYGIQKEKETMPRIVRYHINGLDDS